MIEALGSVLVAASIHAVVRRMRPSWNTVFVFASTSVVVGLGLLWTLLVANRSSGFKTAASLSLYLFLAELYLFSFTFVFGSVSASLLVVTLEGGPTKIEEPGLRSFMVERRLAGLCQSGLILQIDDNYEATAKGRIVARAGTILGTFFSHRTRNQAAVTGSRS